MPIVLIRDTHPRPPESIRPMMQAVHRGVVEALQARPGSVWVRYEPGSPEHYWEGESGTPEGQQVLVFVNLVKGRLEAEIHALFGAISSAIGTAFGIDPAYVWTRVDEFHLDRVGQGSQSYAELRQKK